MSTPPTHVSFWGNFGTRNLGNECTLRAAIEQVRARLPHTRLSCVCPEPEDVQVRHGIAAFPLRRPQATGSAGLLPRAVGRLRTELRSWRDALRWTGRTDLLVMTGTGMLTDEDEGTFGLPYEMFRWAVAARLVGCRLAFLSVGVEPMHRLLTRFFIRTALWLAAFRSYRDRQSRALLANAGFFSERDTVSPDLAFSLLPASADRPVEAAGGRPRVAVGLYDFRRRGAGGSADATAYRAYLDKLCTLVDELIKRGHPVRIVIGDNAYDEPILGDFREALKRRGIDGGPVGIEDAPAQSFEELLQQLDRSEVVIASRFHNVVLALLLGRAVISLSYNEKNDALMAEMGLSDFCQRIDNFQVDWVLERLAELSARGDGLRPVILAKMAEYRRELEQQYDWLLRRPGRSSDGSGSSAGRWAGR